MNHINRFRPIEPLISERFREARLSRGMTSASLAEKIGVSRQSISKYELGQTLPSPEVLYKLAAALDFPVSFFSKPLSISPNRGTTFFRSLKTNSARAKEILSVKSEWSHQLFEFLGEDIEFPECDLPSLPDEYKYSETFLSEDIEDIATWLREYWKLGVSPIPNLVHTLELHGIIISGTKSGFKETDACSAFINARPFIFLDTQKECAVRTRFDLAHELGHLLLHNDVSQADLGDQAIYKRVEQQANDFAAAFLMPERSFSLDIRSTSLFSFVELKRKWKVSIQAMIRRCKDLQIFTENQTIYLYKQIAGKRWRQCEPYDDEWPCEKPVLLQTAVRMLLERGDFTKDEFVELFRLPSNELEQICSLPLGFLKPPGNISNVIKIDFNSKI